jgi:ATP-binding cassette subfamily C protein
MKSAFRILFYSSWQREVAIIAVTLLNGVIDAIGIATAWPIMALVTGEDNAKSGSIGQIVPSILKWLGIPMTIEVLCGIVIGIALLDFACSVAGSVFIGRSVAAMSTDLRLNLIRAVVNARWSFFTSQPVARFSASISSDGIRASQAYRAAGNVVAGLVKALVFFAMALWISWQFFLGGLLIVLVLWLAVSRFMRMAKQAGRGKTKQNYLLAKNVTDALTNIKALKAMNRQGFVQKAFIENVERLREALTAETYSESAIRVIQEPLLIQLLLGGIYVAYKVFGLQLEEIVGSVFVLNGLSSAISATRGAMQRVMVDGPAFWSIIKLTEETQREAEQVHAGAEPSFDGGIRFEGVSFAYGETPVVQDVELELPPKAITTVIGASGAGKTTIADLLVGLHSPTQGRVTVAGRGLADLDTIAWRRQIGYIPQETILFNDTIANNVTLGDTSISRESVVAALKAADAWSFVSKLSGDIDYVIGVRGSLLSGGQRQRLSIARALCNDPKLLILDEATSALDRATAAEIAGGIRKLVGQKTILAITHQPVWVDAADRVYEIRAGVVKPA